MKNKSLFGIMTIFFAAIILVNGCVDRSSDVYLYESKSPVLPESPFNYKNQEVKNRSISDALKEKVNDNTATLGRVLFYDNILSKTNTVSCASCHQQSLGFADNTKFSKGFNGNLTKRNSMSICNTLAFGSFFWDGRESKLENLVLQPVKDHIEMGMERIDVLTLKLEKAGYYEPLFKKAFGDKTITIERISTALAQFVHSMVSTSARVNDVVGNSWVQTLTIPDHFTTKEREGAELFFGKAKCGECHSINTSPLDLFFNNRTANIGLDVNPTDIGIGEINALFTGSFRVPSLSNVALSGPYMHDGRFNTLEEVINHYNKEIKPSKNLDGLLKDEDGNPLRLDLTENEISSLIAFLHTFTDEVMIKDDKFSDPFKQ